MEENVWSTELPNWDTFNNQTSTKPEWVPLDTFIGLVLAFTSCFFIGTSVIFKKLALQDIESRGLTRAVDGGYGYLKVAKWWLGISLMALGELTNFVAYIFAPAILVTPLGVFSIVWTATLSPCFLKEKLNIIGKIGCILVLVGCIMVTLCGPKDKEVTTMEDLESQLLHPGFLIYASIVTAISVVLMILVPRYGHKYVMLYLTICSSFGSLSVMFCKGVGLAIKQTITQQNEFTNWATWVCVVALIVCLLIETVYMQRALDLFNSSVFMSVNYVMFTSLVIIASSILYTELREIGWKNIILTILGFVVNIAALYLLHLDKSPKPDVEDAVNNNLPEQDPETPLMAKTKKSPCKTKDSDTFLSNLRTNGQQSSMMTLTPSLLKGRQYISLELEKPPNISRQLSSSTSSEDHPSCSTSNPSSVLGLPEDSEALPDIPMIDSNQCTAANEKNLETDEGTRLV